MPEPTPELLALQAALAGRYTVERELGRGGMGIVFLARDLTLERSVAIKLLPPRLAAEPDLRERFLRETRTAAGLSHPNIVSIFAIEEHEDLVWYVMGYVEGETLTQRVWRAGPLSVAEATRLMQETAWALSYAHGRGIVHRDVKPDNILLERATGRAFVTDFGIARVATAATMTAAGETLGTPQFMSPEQAAGEPLDGRSDLYSLGVVAFFALTGRLPFEGTTMQAILAMHLTQPPPPLASLRPGLPQKLIEVVDRLLAKERSERYATGEAMVNAVQAAQAPVAEVAAQVRSFLRGVELLAAQVLTVTLMLFAMVEFRPAVAQPAAILWSIFAGVSLLQIVARTRALLRDGFRYADVQAAFAGEERERDDLLALASSDPRTKRRLAVGRIALLFATLVLTVAVVIGGRSVRGSAEHVLGLALLGLGLLAFATAIFNLARDPRFTQRAQRMTARLWMTRFGRTIFGVAGMGVRDGAAGPATPGAQQTRSVAALLAALPADTRKRLGDASSVIAKLELGARTLEQREREIGRSLAEAGDAASDGALGARRRQIVADLEAAQRSTAAQRTEVALTLENIRVQLLRVRSGVGRAEDAREDIEVGRRLAASLNGG